MTDIYPMLRSGRMLYFVSRSVTGYHHQNRLCFRNLPTCLLFMRIPGFSLDTIYCSPIRWLSRTTFPFLTRQSASSAAWLLAPGRIKSCRYNELRRWYKACHRSYGLSRCNAPVLSKLALTAVSVFLSAASRPTTSVTHLFVHGHVSLPGSLGGYSFSTFSILRYKLGFEYVCGM